MATISAKLVKELREKTGAGMMDCKKALSNQSLYRCHHQFQLALFYNPSYPRQFFHVIL
jgi:hypothetical protein